MDFFLPLLGSSSTAKITASRSSLMALNLALERSLVLRVFSHAERMVFVKSSSFVFAAVWSGARVLPEAEDLREDILSD